MKKLILSLCLAAAALSASAETQRKLVFAAGITPLTEDGRLDVPALEKAINRNARHGLDGLFILGSIGEWQYFDEAFRDQYIAAASKFTKGKMDLLVGVTSSSVNTALLNMKKAAKYDFDSYVFMIPPGCNEDPVEAVLRVLDASDRPVYYYHCPPNNRVNLNAAQFERLFAHPRLKGVKNSAGDMALRRELILLKKRLGSNVRLFEGHEWAVDEALFSGYDGMLCGIGSLGSNMMVQLARKADAGDWNGAKEMQEKMIDLFHGVYGERLQHIWTGEKYALQLLGVFSTPVSYAQPLSTLTPEAKAGVEAAVAKYREELQ